MLTDPIADMLTRIRNANKALHEHATMPSSRMKVDIAKLLKEEGYIRDYHVEKGESFDTLVIDLKFGRNRERILTDLKRVSKPGRRVYARKDRLPRVLGGMGTAILSTSGGLITSKTAEERVNGEDVARRQATATPEVQGAQLHALQPVRTAARGLPQVRALPDLPPRARAPGRHSRHDEVELVGENSC